MYPLNIDISVMVKADGSSAVASASFHNGDGWDHKLHRLPHAVRSLALDAVAKALEMERE